MGRAIARDGLNACSLSHGLLKDEHLMRLTTLLMMCVATVLLQGYSRWKAFYLIYHRHGHLVKQSSSIR